MIEKILERLEAEINEFMKDVPDGDYLRGNVNFCAIAKEIVQEVAREYKDRKAYILPCGIGADVYIIPSETNFRLNLLHGHGELNRVYHQKVDRITIHENGWYMEGDKEREYGTGRLYLDRFYGETWFLTEAEAEEALAKMGGKA